jgi:hypothetical protein
LLVRAVHACYPPAAQEKAAGAKNDRRPWCDIKFCGAMQDDLGSGGFGVLVLAKSRHARKPPEPVQQAAQTRGHCRGRH